MPKIAAALVVALLATLVPFAGVGSASTAADSGALAAATKKCKKGYVLKTVKVKKRIRGKLRTVKVKRCVKKKVPTTIYKGQATHRDTSVRYGAVLIHRKGNEVTLAQIRGVVSTECPGLITLDYRKGMRLVADGSATVSGGKVHLRYEPNPNVDRTITIDITFQGSKAQGEFRTTGDCTVRGLFTAGI